MPDYFGIDFGTSTLYVTKWNEEKQKAEPVPKLIPSEYGTSNYIDNVVYYDPSGEIILGKRADKYIQLDPLNGVREIKRHLEDDGWFQEIHGDKKTAINITADILAYIKKRLETVYGNDCMTGVVISVPYAFDPSERKKIESAANQAGIPLLALIEEPVAAALSSGLFDDMEPGSREIVLVFDLGGGTFDVTLFEAIVSLSGKRSVSVKNTDGDKGLGGVNIDHLLVEKFLSFLNTRFEYTADPVQRARFRNDLYEQARQTKINLSFSLDHEVFKKFDVVDEPLDKTVSRKLFEGWLEGSLLFKIDNVLSRVLDDVNMDASKIDQIILVGGSSNIPIIAQKVTDFFQKRPKMIDNPSELVGKGAAIYSGIVSGSNETIQIIRRTSHGFGVQIGENRIKHLITRNGVYTEYSPFHDFTLPDHVERGRIKIYQGNTTFLEDSLVVGHLVVNQSDYHNGVIRIQLKITDNGLVYYRTYDLKSKLVSEGEVNTY